MAVAKTVQILAAVAVVALAIYMQEAAADTDLHVRCLSREDCLLNNEVITACGQPDNLGVACCAGLRFAQAGNETFALNFGSCTCCTNSCMIAFAHAATDPQEVSPTGAHADALIQKCTGAPPSKPCRVDDDKDEKEDD